LNYGRGEVDNEPQI